MSMIGLSMMNYYVQDGTISIWPASWYHMFEKERRARLQDEAVSSPVTIASGEEEQLADELEALNRKIDDAETFAAMAVTGSREYIKDTELVLRLLKKRVVLLERMED